MSLEEINSAVMESVKREADLIVKSAQKEAEEQLKKIREETERECELWYQTAIRSVDEEVSRKLVQVQGQINKEVLKEKNEIINKVFERAKQRILSLPTSEYEVLMKGLLLKTVTEGMKGKIRVHRDEVEIFRKIIGELSNTKQVLLVIDDIEYLRERGGFLFIGEGYIVDHTLGTILSDFQRELVPEIAKQLFG
ncbi:MAG: V-type ATP synthase subunit E family protein [Candidatus Hydrogenedentes bacterium]|nr:V-type ATP synthase subunit E family protein [Candidatus Hydrogenedentota bacterium]